MNSQKSVTTSQTSGLAHFPWRKAGNRIHWHRPELWNCSVQVFTATTVMETEMCGTFAHSVQKIPR